MTGMVTNKLRQVVEGFVSNYVIFDDSKVSSTPLTWTFKDTEFQPDLLHKFDITSDLPIYVKASHVGQIHISSTWTFRIERIEVSDVVIIAVPNSKEHNAKQMDSYCQTLFYKLEQAGSWKEYLTPFVSTYVMKGLEVTISNIRFRYEEMQPACSCLEFGIERVQLLYSADDAQDIKINGFSVNIQSDVQQDGYWMNMSNWKANWKQRREPLSEVVADVSIHVTRSPLEDANSGKFEIAVKSTKKSSSEIDVLVRPTQLRSLLAIFDTWRFLLVREVYWAHRPPSHIRPRGVHCRAWWRYAFNVVRETKLFPFKFERIKRYRRFYAEYIHNFKVLNGSDETKAMEALNTLRQLSKVLNRTSIVLAREEAFAQLELVPQEDMSPDFERSGQVGLVKMTAKLPDIRLCLCDETGERLHGVISGLHVKYKNTPLEALTKLSMSLDDASVEYNWKTNPHAPDNWIPILSSVESDKQQLMKVVLESRQAAIASQTVKMFVRPTRAHVYQPTISCVTAAVSKMTAGAGNATITQTSIAYTSQLMSAVFPSSSIMSWDLDVCNPQVILPEWGPMKKDGALLYFDLGHVKSRSDASDVKTADDVLGINVARVENIQVIFAESESKLKSILKKESEGFFMVPSSIDVELQNLSSGRQRLQLGVAPVDLQIDRLNDIVRVLANAGFLRRATSSQRVSSGSLKTKFQQALELQLRRALRSDNGMAEMRDLARDLRLSRVQRWKSRRKALANNVYTDLVQRASAKSPPVSSGAKTLSSSPVLQAGDVGELATERNPLRWELGIAVERMKLEVKMEGCMALTCSEMKIECGKMEYGLCGMFEVGDVECTWHSRGRQIDLLRRGGGSRKESVCQIVFVDLQPNCPRFHSDYGAVRTSVAARFGSLAAHVDQAAIIDIMDTAKNFTEELDEYISEVPESVDLLSKEISRAVNGLIAQNDDMEEEMLRRQSSVVRYHTLTKIGTLSLDLTMGSHRKPINFAHVYMKQLQIETRVHRNWSRYTCELEDCWIEHRRQRATYRRILERSKTDGLDKHKDLKLLSSTIHRHFQSPNPNDCDTASLTMNRVDIVCLPDFVKDMQAFVGRFGRQLAIYSRRVGQRAREEIVNISKSSFRLELTLFMPSPRFLIPIGVDSKEIFTLQLGDLRVETDDPDRRDPSQPSCDRFKVGLASVKFTRAVINNGKIISCSDIFDSEELAGISLSRDPAHKVLEMTVKTYQVQPIISPRDYHNLLTVINSWTALGAAPHRVSDRVDFEPKPEIDVSEESDAVWTFTGTAHVKGIILDIMDCRSVASCVYDQDLVPIGRLEMSDLDIKLIIDSNGDYSLTSNWNGLSLDDMRETEIARPTRLISICKETAKLKYESHGNNNIVSLNLTDMKIYADIIYFRNLVKMFETPEDLTVPEEEQRVYGSQRSRPSGLVEPWTSGSWQVEVSGASLILHCLSEVEVKENSDHRFMDVQLTVHQKHSDGIVRPWRFSHNPEETKLEVSLFVGIDFGYINSLFCHILDSTCVDFTWTKGRWQEECNLILRRRQEVGKEDEQHIGLILSPLLLLHVQRIAQTFISPVGVVRSRRDSSSSSSCSPTSPHVKRLVTTGTLPRRADHTDSPPTSISMTIDAKEFSINDASDNNWLIAPDKLPAMKQFPGEPLDWAQRLTLDCDPVNIHFHMNVDDPILRLDIDVDKFEIDDWQAEVNIRVHNFQVSVWSYNDDEQQWEALIEKLANEDMGVPFVADRPDSFRMWSCDVNLSMRGTRVLGDQTLPELMDDLHYHGEKIKLDSLSVDYPAVEGGDGDQVQEGSIEELARALESQTCYFLQIVSNRQNGEKSEPLLINYSPSTARRISEIMECLTSIQEGTPAHPDKRLIPTLRIINDTGSEMTVAAETEGQLVEPINCTLMDALALMDDGLQTTSCRNSYHLVLKIKGYNPVRCEVGRHSRISTRRLIPSQDSGIQSSIEPDFLLVQTETDLALATVRFTSRYFIENRLELPLLAYICADDSYERIPAKETHALPLCTKDNIKINMESENYKPIECNLLHATHREHLQLVSKDEKSEPTCNFMKTIAIDGMKVTLTFDAFIRINNFLPCTVEIAFQDTKRDKVEISRGKHAFLPMFAQTDSLNLIITVNNYQNSRWRCDYVMKTSSSRRVKRLRLEEVPSGTLVRQSYRTGRFICIASRRTDESDCRIMNLFAPLWIMNDKTNISWHIKERNCPYVVVTPGDEPALLTPRQIASSSNWHKCLIRMCGITEAIDDGKMTPRWSRNIDVGAVCKTVALTVPRTQKLNQGHRMTDGWMLLLKIEQLPFTYSRLVTILPCYILQNRTHHRIVFVEDREDSTPEEYVIPINQTIPFWPRGDSLKARVRREDGTRFSKPFAFNETQSTALKVSDEWAVTVEVSGGIDLKPRAIRFRRYRRGDAPLRIENLCASRNVRLQQLGGKAVVLPEFKYTVYLWDNPCGLRQLTCAVVGECVRECVCQTEFEVPVNSNKGACIKCERGNIYWISFIHENQRTLLVTDKKPVYQRVQSLSQAEPMRLWAQLRLDEVGVSFISNRREIAFLSVSGMAKSKHIRFPGLFLMYQGADKNRLVHLRVSQFRLFNSLWRPIYREVLYDRPDEDKPFLDFGVKWRIADAKCGQAIDMLRIKLSSIIANVDYGFAMTVYGAFIAPNEAMDEDDMRETELNIKRQTLMDIVNTNVGEQEQEYLFRDAVMEDFKLRLSLSGDGKVHGAYEPSVRAYSILAPLVGSIFSQKDTLLNMSQFQRSGLSMPVKNFVNEVLAHLKSNITRQVYMLLLGIDIFGDPITVYHTVTDGFRDEAMSTSDHEEEEEVEHEQEQEEESEDEEAVELLPDEDTESVFRQESGQEDTEPRTRRRSRRRRRGVRASLVPRRGRVSRVVRHVGGGVAHSVAQFTRAMGRIVSKATFDPAYIRERRERFHRAIEPSDCGREAAISLVKGIGAGTFGIVYRPIKGARKSGFFGGVRGLGRGMIGIPTRPIAGTLDAASLGAEGLKRLALHEHFPYPEGRRPRACAHKTFSYFSEWEAFGQKILFSIDEDKYTITKGNRYRAHVLIGSKKRKAIFVTDTMIIKAKKVFDYKWRTCWTISLDFIRTLESGELSNPKASNEIQRVLIVKHGKNEGDNRTKRIFLPEDKCHQISRGYLKAAIERAKRESSSSSKHIK